MNTFIKHVQEQFKLVTAFIAGFPLLVDYFNKSILNLTQTEIVITGLLCFLSLNALFNTREIFYKRSWLFLSFLVIALSVAGFVILNSFEPRANGVVLGKIFSYMFFTSGGILILLYGFVKEERNTEMMGKVQSLENDKQKFFREFVDTLYSLKNTENMNPSIPIKSRIAFTESTNKIFEEVLRTFNKLSKGTIEIRGSAMDEIYKRFLDRVHTSFKAISYDDINYWASEESKQYFKFNKNLVERGISTERIFLLPRDFKLSSQSKKVILDQIAAGITVRIGFIHKIKELNIPDDVRVLDFGLFDDFAVSFWHKTNGRLFKVVTSLRVCAVYLKAFEIIRDHCEIIPDKKGDDQNIFQSPDELELWCNKDKKYSFQKVIV